MILDDFFYRAILAGVGVALVCGPFGCFMVWRRMSYFGDTLAHSALLGVAVGALLSLEIVVAVFGVSTVLALLLFYLERMGGLSIDALLGILSHSTLALGIVALAFMPWMSMDLHGLLFGDILSVTRDDIKLIYGGGTLALLGLAYIYKGLFAATLSPEIAAAEGQRPERVNMIFMILLSLLIAVAMKIIGVLLITALLIIPAATARRFAWSPESMLGLASILGILSVIGGMYGSLEFDTPSGPSIVVVAMLLFIASLIVGFVTRVLSVTGLE